MQLIRRASGRLGWMIGTGLGSGLSPLAPGTAGSLVAILIYSFAPVGNDSVALYALIVLGFIVGIWATGTLITPTNPDPGGSRVRRVRGGVGHVHFPAQGHRVDGRRLFLFSNAGCGKAVAHTQAGATPRWSGNHGG